MCPWERPKTFLILSNEIFIIFVSNVEKQLTNNNLSGQQFSLHGAIGYRLDGIETHVVDCQSQ